MDSLSTAAHSKHSGLRQVNALRFLMALLIFELLLMLSQRQRWFGFNEQKGWTVLIALVGVLIGLALVVATIGVRFLLRKPVQFSLQTLLAAAVVVAILCGWFANEIGEADQQKRTVRAAEQAGCGIIYDYSLNEAGGIQFFSGPRPGATWLHAWLGDDFFHEVVGVRVSNDEGLFSLRSLRAIRRLDADNSQVTDLGMQVVESFTVLEQIDLRDASQIGDDGLRPLRNLNQLQILMLRRTRVSDAGIAHLRNLTNLEVLDLGMTPVTGEGLKQLSSLTRLRQLSFWGNKIDDDALTAVRGMIDLESLDLGGATITDAGLEPLEALFHLEVLGVRGSSITDEGIQRLAQLKKLRQLDLFNTRITDASLEQLARFDNLKTLYLGDTLTTPDGVKRLQERLPHCKIER